MSSKDEILGFFVNLPRRGEYKIISEVNWSKVDVTAFEEVSVYIESEEKFNQMMEFLIQNKVSLPHYPQWKYVLQYSGPGYLHFNCTKYREGD